MLHRIAMLIPIALALGSQSPLFAGGGPEGVLVVVNSKSQASLAIANHFIALRQIPAVNVLYLDWDPATQTTDVETFRSKILRPVLDTITSRGLAMQIDCVAYSADFPWRIDFAADLPEAQRKGPFLSGSLTGLTYLMTPVISKNPAYATLNTNQYMRLPNVGAEAAKSTHGFRNWYGWGPQGELMESGGNRYLLSVMLGVTAGRGNSVAEIIAALKRSTAADGTAPKGAIYYMRNKDVRSTTRQSAFDSAVAQLKKLGLEAENLEGQVPTSKADVAGAMIGVAAFDWSKSGSRILPGAICEHLTSFGGVFDQSGQTPLSEFIRHGAAGSSGTIIEPFAIQAKFPHPMIHVHYARGCSLAEAFYQSVHGPYQLLIVGDPLCRPWANIPQIKVEGVAPGAAVKDTLEILPTAKLPRGGSVDRFELFVDGVRNTHCAADENLNLDSTKLSDGYHELRIVGIEAGPIETQGRLRVPITVINQKRSIRFSVTPKKARPATTLKLKADAPGATSIVFYSNSQVLGRIKAAQGELAVGADRLGQGPVQLRAIALGDSPEKHVVAQPINITVE